MTRGYSNLIAMSMLGMLLLAGCATSAPTAKFTQEIAGASRVSAKDDTKVRIEATGEVVILSYEKERLAERIQEKLSGKKALNASAGEKREFEVEVTLSRYEKGNAFARAMLIGLGQIHIDAKVRMFELPDKKLAGEFTVNKTFAWGGLYGGMTSMEDVEKGFADGVAAALTGQKEDAPKKK